MSNDKIINLHDKRAEAAGVKPEFSTVIEQLNQHFGVNLFLDDPRLDRFKSLFSVLDAAAERQHEVQTSGQDQAFALGFSRGFESGRAQMMTDLIICLLEEDGVVVRTT